MKEIELLKTFNKWRRGSGIPQPDPADIGRAIDSVVAECESLQAQNDELRASNESLRKAFDKALELACQDYACSENFYEYAKEKLDKTPTQSLADIRAEAVMSIMDKAHSCETPNGDIAYSSELIHDYANKIKGAE